MLLPVTLTVPASVAVAKLSVKLPAPVMLEPALDVKVPPRLSVVPAGTVIMPLSIPPPVNASVPP